MLDAAYERANYGLEIDYRTEPLPLSAMNGPNGLNACSKRKDCVGLKIIASKS